MQVQNNRQGYLGSADIAAVLGISPWKTAYQLWEEKTYGVTDEPDEAKQRILSRGHRFEPVILDQYVEETGAWIVNRNQRYQDSEHPFMWAECDAEEQVEETGEIIHDEVKSVSAFAARDWGPSGTDEYPSYYIAQTQYTLGIRKDIQRTKLIALIGTDDLRVYESLRNQPVIDHIREEGRRFWYDNVLAKVPPPLVNSADAERMIARFDGFTIKVTPETRTAMRRLKGIGKAIGRLEAAKESYSASLKLAIVLGAGDVEKPTGAAIVDENGKPMATWKMQERKGFTVAPTEFRVLRLTKEAK